MASRFVKLCILGKTNYKPCMGKMKMIVDRQLEHLEVKEQDIKNDEVLDTLILTEHVPTYTVGHREVEDLPPYEKERLESLGAAFAVSDRGGWITYHGPGQLTIYPVLNLRNFNITIKEYITCLEEIAIMTCKDFGIQADKTENVGAWVGNNKIASIGVRNSNLITSHGMAFNCNVNLKWYSHIVACGLYGKGTTSLKKELDKDVPVEEAKQFILKNFKTIFGCELIGDEKTKVSSFLEN